MVSTLLWFIQRGYEQAKAVKDDELLYTWILLGMLAFVLLYAVFILTRVGDDITKRLEEEKRQKARIKNGTR